MPKSSLPSLPSLRLPPVALAIAVLLVLVAAGLLAVAAVAVIAGASAMAQEEPGAIRALVFRDLDGNGVQDDGEPGQPRQRFDLNQGDQLLSMIFTGSDGTNVFDGLTSGIYTVSVGLEEIAPGACVDGAGVFFDPFPNDYCAGARLPWRATTPDSVSVTVESGMTVEVAFGVQPRDVAVVTGAALLEDGYAPAGTLIEALVNGQECGTTAVLEDHGSLNYAQLVVLGAGERAGCATPGDEVRFRVGGILAAETLIWRPFIDTPGLQQPFHLQHLSAMEERAWYWLQGQADDLPAVGSTVEAVVHGVVCGDTVMEASTFTPGRAGFPRLFALSEALQPGCGRPGATVAFLVDGVEVGSIPWQAGLQRLELAAPVPVLGPVAGSGQGPVSGRGPQAYGGGATTTLIAVLFATGLLLAGGSRLLDRRR